MDTLNQPGLGDFVSDLSTKVLISGKSLESCHFPFW